MALWVVGCEQNMYTMYVTGSVHLCGPVDPVDLWTLWTCGPVDLWTCGPVDLWTCGPVDLWTCGPVDLWTCGPVDLWTCGPVDLWTCGPVGCGPNNYNMYVTGSVDVCGPVDLWVVDRITISCTQQEVWISEDLWTCGPVGCGQNIHLMYVMGSVDPRTCGHVDLWTCGLWTEYLYDVCNRKCGPLWTCGPVGSVQILHGVSLIM